MFVLNLEMVSFGNELSLGQFHESISDKERKTGGIKDYDI